MTDVLDRAQLVRIEATHRGFLYQHLYAVGCLLLSSTSGATALLVERDEDIEVISQEWYDYIQVKSRTNPLRMSDINSAIKRMIDLRATHEQGERTRTPRFWIVTDSSPGPELHDQIRSSSWPEDIKLIWPGQPLNSEAGLPPAWPNLPEALAWCTEIARTIPYSRLSADTLIWKLTALIQYACTGTSSREQHRINVAELPELFEQILIQLQDFPDQPSFYRPHEGEPQYYSDKANRIRLIVGFSGAGKTAWSAQLALHVGPSTAYYAITPGSGLSLASSLARELAARFLKGEREGFAQALLPGISGLESLRVVDLALQDRQIEVVVVLDNVHLATALEIKDLIAAASTIQFILLAQGGPVQKELEGWLGIESEFLNGWPIDTIAAEFAANDLSIDPHTAQKVRHITGGLPLYVRSVISLTTHHYGGNVQQLCIELETQTHIESIQQEIILSRIFQNLPNTAQLAVALLSISTVPLVHDEAIQVLTASLKIEAREIAQAIRYLTDFAVVQKKQDQKIIVHDAFRIVCSNYQISMDKVTIQTARLILKDIVLSSLLKSYNPHRMSLFIRLLVDTGDYKTLVDISGYEQLRERGHFKDVQFELDRITKMSDLDTKSRFWALDTLVSQDFKSNNMALLEERIVQMEQLLVGSEDMFAEKLALLIKKMLTVSKKRDYLQIRNYFIAIQNYVHDDPGVQDYIRDNPEVMPILHYNYTLSLYLAGFYRQATEEAFSLVIDYFDILGLHFSQLFAKNVPDIAPLLEGRDIEDEVLKRAGDALKLLASSLLAQGKNPGLAHLHAVKFYDLAHAPSSLVSVGQDVADEFLTNLRDPALARDFIANSLLPAINHYQLMDHVVPVRAHYAVLLAYCGEGSAALGEMERLSAFYNGLPEERRREFDKQRVLITEILAGRKQLAPPKGTLPAVADPDNVSSPDKNDPCPCGSGKKFRNCHGRGRSVPAPNIKEQPNLSERQIDTDDIEQAMQHYFEISGGRDAHLRRLIYSVAMNNQPCDVLTKSREQYIDVYIHHDIIARIMYGLIKDTELPDRLTLLKDGVVVGEIRSRNIWVVQPMPKSGFTEEELSSVDMAEGNKRTANGLTIRQMVRDTYNCKTNEELDFFLRRWLAS